MRAVRLYGPGDLRFEELPDLTSPGARQILLRSKAVGICGSDLHMYQDGRIGTATFQTPLVLGHEFAGVVEAAGGDALDGNFEVLQHGMAVAVDPAQPCGQCEQCETGNPNLCHSIRFCGYWPDDGALREYMIVPARTCFPLPAGTTFAEGAMLETLGVALHAVDLARVHVADSMAILGAGPIGLCILQVARLAGASPVFVSDKYPWRLDVASRFGGTAINCDRDDAVDRVMSATNGRGVDVAIEAAWADRSVQQAIEIVRLGGRVVLVGIPGDDRLEMKHSVARRKGLTIRMARRMKHTYPRAIDLHRRGLVDLASIISHRFPLERTAEAFAMNLRYERGVNKVVIDL
jgi:L-iditol 2-dehydrogenase